MARLEARLLDRRDLWDDICFVMARWIVCILSLGNSTLGLEVIDLMDNCAQYAPSVRSVPPRLTAVQVVCPMLLQCKQRYKAAHH
jgi:hypothetical protein